MLYFASLLPPAEEYVKMQNPVFFVVALVAITTQVQAALPSVEHVGPELCGVATFANPFAFRHATTSFKAFAQRMRNQVVFYEWL